MSHVKNPFGTKKGGTALLIIDPQNDFHEGGSLAVPGATFDSANIAALIHAQGSRIHQIHVTLDSHHKLHIANPFFWVCPKNTHPPPFTTITREDILTRKWVPSRAKLIDWCLSYVDSLRLANNTLTIWPEHCIIGTPGQCVVPVLNDALQTWAGEQLDIVQYIQKGSNPLTEMYSGLSADVPIESDPSTQFNHDVLDRLLEADRVLICGEALSHCVKHTMHDLLSVCPPDRIRDVYVLADATSSVKGFEQYGNTFLNSLAIKGVNVVNIDELTWH